MTVKRRLILVVGGADTGRAPMTAAMLQRMVNEQSKPWKVESAGILGHDGDPPTTEAVATMEQMSLTIARHRARTLTLELVNQAPLLITLDRGTALVARMQYPELESRFHTLGQLAGRDRDIPDPFKMQIGAWLTYAIEIEKLLRIALPRLNSLMGDASTEDGEVADLSTPVIHAMPISVPSEPTVAVAVLSERTEMIARMTELLRFAQQMPSVVDWNAARQQLISFLDTLMHKCGNAPDLILAYSGILRAGLSLTTTTPSVVQLGEIIDAVVQMKQPITPSDVATISNKMSGWRT